MRTRVEHVGLILLAVTFVVACNGGDNKAARQTVTGPSISVVCRPQSQDGTGGVTVTTTVAVDCGTTTTTAGTTEEE